MAHAVIDVTDEFLLEDPSLIIGFDGAGDNGLQLRCAMSQIDLDERTREIRRGTFCKKGAKITKIDTRTIKVTVRQSFGATGLFNQIKQYEFQTVPFALLADHGATIGADNPEMSGTVFVGPVKFLQGTEDASEAMTYTIDLEIQEDTPDLRFAAPSAADHTL